MAQLVTLLGEIFILMITGLILKKSGILGEQGKRVLTNLVLYLVLPCNTVTSFEVSFSEDTLQSFVVIFIISIVLQAFCMAIGRVIYPKGNRGRWKCLYYGTVCSNAGFLGNPIAEGVFGPLGLVLASVYLIPQRIVMWSSGLSVFSEAHDRKQIIKKVVLHPCILACGIGLFLMLSDIHLPAALDKSVAAIGSCNTALSMMAVGMILADLKPSEFIDRDVAFYTLVRLVLIPICVYIPCILLRLDATVTGVAVLLAAMPAGATTSMLATEYHADDKFATKMIVFSTVMSMASTPIWSLILA